ncbi:putative Immunoglobulin V-set domain-containing protein 2, partial [Homarus americanus]
EYNLVVITFLRSITWSSLPAPGWSAALEIQEVEVPEYKVRGSRAELSCRYKLDNATLYSLKWYKGDKLFYQYIPANNLTKNTFLVPGVNVDVGDSTGVTVVLQDLELVTSGTYKCEVITEAPLFITKFGHGNMTVI